MNKPIAANPLGYEIGDNQSMYAHLSMLSKGLLQLLIHQFPADNESIQQSIGFLQYFVNEYLEDKRLVSRAASSDGLSKANLPLQRLVNAWRLSELEVSLLVLSGMAHEHEAFDDLFRRLHPEHKPYPTPSLLLHIFGNQTNLREQLAGVLMNSPLVNNGLLSLSQQGSVYASSLVVKPHDYLSLKTGLLQNINEDRDKPLVSSAGLKRWLGSSDVAKAMGAIKRSANVIIHLHHGDIKTALNRAKVMLQSNDIEYIHVCVNAETQTETLQSLFFQSIVTQTIPLLEIRDKQKYLHETINKCPLTLVLCTSAQTSLPTTSQELIDIAINRLSIDEHQAMWLYLLPALKEQSRELAIRFPIEPYQALQRISILPFAIKARQSSSQFEATIKALKVSCGETLPQGVMRIIPALDWSDLVLPEIQIQDLKGAINRLKYQHKVIDEWQFLQNKRGAKGVRLLFSGPPGTGKTLTAEILANSIGTDLLVIDLAGLVSKWIGETEKNLASIFHYAEQTRAVLFFDEADAVFGKRTEVNDANDRYANLETAYLLSRLESYDSIAILATNLRNNIDPAFTRRLDYCIEFKEPNAKERERLWRCHIPKQAPLDTNVDFAFLAGLYPMVGGEIKNAAVGGAYRAAQLQQNIKQEHFIDAIRRELEKSGKTFREVNPL